MSLSRPFTGFEKAFINTKELVQLAVELDPKDIVPSLNKLQKKVIGLRLKRDSDNLILSKESYPIQRIPDYVKNVREAVEWAETQHFDFKETMSIVSANDRFIVINSSHSVTDGGALSTYLKSLYEDEKVDSNEIISFPKTFNDFFSKEIEERRLNPNFKNVNEDLNQTVTFYKWNQEPVQNFDPSTKASYFTFIENVEKFQCYNKKTQKCEKLTENNMGSIMLATNAINILNKKNNIINDGNIMNNIRKDGIDTSDCVFGCSVCVDMRQFLPRNVNMFEVGNFFTLVVLGAQNFSLDMTLNEFYEAIRKNFSKQKQNDGLMDAIYSMDNGKACDSINLEKTPISTVILSNVGLLQVKPPVKDVWMSLKMSAMKTDPELVLLSYGRKGNGKNDVVNLLRYSSRVIPHEDAKIMGESMKFMLTNIPPTESVGTALNEVYKFQKQFKQ
ncbi:hypothetical protein TRFO_22047 [Tritrichomonas foetus]|uniref:Condensation domain-containing protein n=1 Tax=Tritrichomonas foetus TaxID=1144522 RepID=A0A1J4KIR2_9EUKA|nr:hypothetical protein TRFO_22047 [Tritrichomonas foetus]|eukprot:OHT09205.1 hypothetical protein TRFO_22047 [Tritrichomonas foetus]